MFKHLKDVARMYCDEILSLVAQKTNYTPKGSGKQFLGRCPAHDDSNPSLSIAEGEDGKVLLKCFAGCPLEEITSSLGIKVTDLFPEQEKPATSTKREYVYRNELGKELYKKIRIEPGFDGKKKSFYFERFDEDGKVVKNTKGCRKVLYHLPNVIAAIKKKETVFLVEGEKDADKLASYGLTATTAPESLKWLQEFTETLKGANVVLLYDMDNTGRKRKDLLVDELHKHVAKLRVVELPGLEFRESHGEDISDWLRKGHTTADLLQIVENTPDYRHKKSSLIALNFSQLMNLKLPPRELILAPILPTQGLCMLFALRGVGKTHVALGIAYAVANGGSFLRWHAPIPRKVLYIDGEMPLVAMQERLRMISLGADKPLLDSNYLQLVNPDVLDIPFPDLSTNKGRAVFEPLIDDCELVIIDNISCCFRSGVENEAESWQAIQSWALAQRKRGKSILFVHHAGKNGRQRGTSKREDTLDTVIQLKRPKAYQPDQGACFEVHYEKNRHFFGKEAEPFQAHLQIFDEGKLTWKISNTSVDEEIEEIADLFNQGMTFNEIIDETGLTKSKIETRRKKAKRLGLLE